MIIVVEGNIGAGKTTFCEDLCEQLTVADKEKRTIVFLREPVDMWTSANGENMLKLYYENKKRWAFTFQCLALATMIQNESRAVKLSEDGHIVIMERSSFSSKEIFSDLLGEDVFTRGEVQTFHELKTIAQSPLETYTDLVIVYLKTSPEICLARTTNRERPEEVGLIDISYLRRLHDAHETKLREGMVHGVLLEMDGSTYERGTLLKTKLVRGSASLSFKDALRGVRILQDEKET